MADPIELARVTPEQTLPAVDGGVLRGVREFVEGSAFAWGLSYLGFAILVFVLLAAVLLAPLLAIAFPIACAVHDARSRRAPGAA